MNKEEKKAYDKKRNELNKETNRIRVKEWRDNNPDKVKEYYKSDKRKEYRVKNAKIINKKTTDKRRENKEEWNAYRRENHKKRIASDPLYRLKINIKSLISGSFKKKGNHKTKKTLAILGCSFEDYKKHIESQFEIWMTWDNYGAYKIDGIRTWQIDHIIPISSAKTSEELIKLNHFSNLRPLCSKANLDKSNKIDPL